MGNKRDRSGAEQMRRNKMKVTQRYCKLAVVQASPVPYDKEATLKKAIGLIDEAGKAGADLIIFPEAYIPTYPRGFSFGFVVGKRYEEGREDWKRYYDNSVLVPSADTDLIGEAAKRAGAYVCMGVTERCEENCTLYCSYLYFGPDGTLLGTHRKLKPTGSERCVWGEGDGSGLIAIDTPFGKVGALICWEDYMPLARAALYQKGISIYLAPTAASHPEWQASMKHIAYESRCYVASCNMILKKSMIPKDFNNIDELDRYPEMMCPGGSCVVGPLGKHVVEPVFEEERIIYADLDMEKVPLARMDFDPVGHYSRPDVLELIVHEPKKG